MVVVPTYKERDNVPVLVEKIHELAPDVHILIVDDNSPDGTGEVADQLSEANKDRVFVLHRQRKEGLGRAYTDGFKYALAMGYDIVLQMDADLSHDPIYLPVFLEHIRSCDLVLGSRYLHGISVVNWDLKRLMLSKLASAYVRLVTGMPFTDPTGGFKCWRAGVLRSIGLDEVFSNGYLFQIEMTCKAYRKGFRIVELPIVFFERRLGRSKLDLAVIREALFGVLKLRFKR
jgi:dolichol-phosphate mannosyltransferase